MESLFTDHPIVASGIGFVIFVLLGVVDLLVLRNRTIALLFWILGFFVVLSPLVNLPSLSTFEWFLILCLGVVYVVVVYRTYAFFKDPLEKDTPAAK
jgi:hypothetical protein